MPALFPAQPNVDLHWSYTIALGDGSKHLFAGREEKRTQTEDTEHTGVNGVLLLPEPAPNVMETCAA